LLRVGYTDVVDADLSKYFDTIPHAELLNSVARRIVDRRMLRLIKMWLTVPRKRGGGAHVDAEGDGPNRTDPERAEDEHP
jgi:RNA-directed DNA polymerase